MAPPSCVQPADDVPEPLAPTLFGKYDASEASRVLKEFYLEGDIQYTIDGERVILTRTRLLKVRFNHRPLVFINDNDPFQQMKQVVRARDIQWHEVDLFSRCLSCNEKLLKADRDAVAGQVPAYVWQHHDTFYSCGQCGRIYWAGSHHERMHRRLSALFQNERRENP